VPVTETCLLLVEAKVQERVVLPEPATLVGVTVHEEVVLVARLTTPVNPLTELNVIVELPAEFTLTLILIGLAAIIKS
jgi:hypothetical protein